MTAPPRPPASTPGGDELQHRYRVLRRLLAANSEMLELMADLEADLAHLEPGEHVVRRPVLRLLDGSLLLAENLNILTGDAHRGLYDAHAGIERDIRAALRSFPRPEALPLVLPLGEECAARVREVGGKAGNLGLARGAMPDEVPPGFVLTTAAYRFFLAANRLHEPIRDLFANLSLVTGRRLFSERTAAIRSLITSSPVPDRILEAIDAGVQMLGDHAPPSWAVRSSAVGEDGRMSFAGQFDSVLAVLTDELAAAYRRVLASRWNDHAVLYRLVGGFTEVDTPMAVLVMPMLDPRAAGVMYTRDPRDQTADRMLVDAVAGLAEAMVRDEAAAWSYLPRRSAPGELSERPSSAAEDDATDGAAGPLSGTDVRTLVELGLRLEERFGNPQDVEWVITRDGRTMAVQCRPLRVADRDTGGGGPAETSEPIARGGMTVFPGRAVGPVHLAPTAEELAEAPEGAIVVVRQAGPELAAVLPRVGGVIAGHGNPASHAAALIREFAVPALFGLTDAEALLGRCPMASLDATQRVVFEGALWPDVRERLRSRIRHAEKRRRGNPVHELVLALNLTDPQARAFRPKGCRSIHDVVRYVHEKAVAAMFHLGDEVGRRGPRRVWRLDTTVPLNVAVLDLGGTLPPGAQEKRTVPPEELASVPFAALWRGITRKGVSWAGRTQISLGGFASVVAGTVADPSQGVRDLGSRNYLMVAPDYVNLNARLAYHFAMVDALVSPVPENNFVNFRFRGGAANERRRFLRASFLAEVLARSGFSVDRRGDLVTAWMRRYPAAVSEEGLALLGALMPCARQLDMLMSDEARVRHLVERFLAGDYAAFG